MDSNRSLDGFLKAWRNWPALLVQHQYLELGHFCLPVSPVVKSAWRNWQAKVTKLQILMLDKQNVLAENEMFENFGGGETSKQGQAAETISCQANNVAQFRQAFTLIRGRILLYIEVTVKPLLYFFG